MGVRREKKPRKKMGKKKKLKLVPSRLCGAKWRKWGERKKNGEKKYAAPMRVPKEKHIIVLTRKK